jgi:hypothetical protein
MPEETKIDVGDDEEDSVDVNIKEGPDTSEAASAVIEVEASNEEELEEYSSGVKGRINELTKRFREEERQKQSAITFAENVRKENEILQERIKSLDKGFLEQFDGRLSVEMESAKSNLREAHEIGDVDKIVSAQESMAELTVQKSNRKRLDPSEDDSGVAVQEQAPVAVQEPAPAKADPKAEYWATNNSWFGQDEVMTYGAFGIHRRLVEDEGFDPASDDYYVELDSRLRIAFPHKFDSRPKTGGRRVASAESSKSRNKSGRKTVRLSSSQVAIAKRLNVPLDEYAKYVRD